MNPINDEILLKDSKDIEDSSEHLKETEDSADVQESNEHLKDTKLDEDLKESEEKINENLKDTSSHKQEKVGEIHDHQQENEKSDEISIDSKLETETRNEKQDKESNIGNVNEDSSESDANEIDKINENIKAVIESSSLENVNEDSTESAANKKVDNRKENMKTGIESSGLENVKEDSSESDANEKDDNKEENIKKVIESSGLENANEDSSESDANEKDENKEENIKKVIETSGLENANEDSSESDANEKDDNKEKNMKNVIESSGLENVNEDSSESDANEIDNSKENKKTVIKSSGLENVNEDSTESAANEKDENSQENMKKVIETTDLESSEKLENDSMPHEFEDAESATEDESDEFENVEDVEIPGDEEVDEIIVPDEAEAEDLTDGKDQDEEMEKSQNDEAEDDEEEEEEEEEPSLKESDVEDNESVINSHEAEEVQEEENTKSSEAAEKDEEDDGDGESDKKSVNNDTKEDTCSKSYEEPEELVGLEEVTHGEKDMEQTKSDENDLDEDSTTQASYDPLNCTDNKEADDEGDNENVKIGESENSNASQTLEKEENKEVEEEPDAADEVNSTKNIESGNEENSTESQSQQKDEQHDEQNEEDDEVQFVETRNSPICIESDDDDDDDGVGTAANNDTSLLIPMNKTGQKNDDDNNRRTITTGTTTVTVPRNITVTRTSARKSTAKPPQTQTKASNSSASIVPQIQNRMKNYLQNTNNKKINNKRPFTATSTQKIVDCIELLDSSDEESSSKMSHKQKKQQPTQQQPQRTPQKRTLLAAKGNFYKNKNNSKQTNPTVNRLPHNFTPPIRPQPKKPALPPPPPPPATPQSNFLNAVQLQPAAVTGANPPAFSARLSNKNVIIPNAFYGNPPDIRRSPNEVEAEKRSVRWLENFLNQFCKPQFEPTHSCFVFLQRALKYKDFVRIKNLRTSMNSNVHSASNQLNLELMMDLKTIFFKNVKKITNYGERFCELTCTATAGKAVSLITHRLSGKVTLKTSTMESLKPLYCSRTSNDAASSSSSSSQAGSATSVTRKRQLDEDEDEYTPDKSVYKTKGKPPSENGDEDSGDTGGDDRKRSLRTKRTKRIDNSFSYNEDDLLAEYEIDDEDDEKLALVEIKRKVEQKRLEAQQQRQQQAKSFENAFIQAFAKSIDGPTTSRKTKNSALGQQRIRLKNTATATVTNIRQYTANNDAEDLLQATWIENLETDDTQIISDDDEPQQHRIYKQSDELPPEMPPLDYYRLPSSLTISKVTTINNSPKNTGRATKRTAPRHQEEFITGDDDYEENNYYANNNSNNADNSQPSYWPKNVDPQMTVSGKNKDRCVICSLNCQRLVHHYVNEHRGCETYNSRLSASQIKKIKQGNCTASVSLYKNGQNLYEAFCIFCNKISRFMLRYWYQHYTMHTGEYAYRCTGCGIRKPTQSLLTLHHSQGCPEGSYGITQDYIYDTKSMQIEAKICSLCHYVQLHRSNIVKHLHTQHNIKQILPKHILTVVLMKIPGYLAAAATSSTTTSTLPANTNRRSYNSRSSSAAVAYNSSSTSSNTFIIEDVDNDNDMNYEEILPEETSEPAPANHYYNYIPPYMQAAFNSGNLTFENVDAGDDLSFTICGMFDVQMNTNDAN